MKLLSNIILLFSFILISGCSGKVQYFPDSEFNEGWKFYKGSVEEAEKPAFDDSGWRDVTLPHDWAIEGPFSDSNNARTGGLPIKGDGWYRKHFVADKTWKGKKISLLFDGAMSNAKVYVNGQLAGERPYGYISFEIDMTPYLQIGKQNTVAVHLSPNDLAMRWYPGAGIYRNVHLKIDNPAHFTTWGTRITDRNITDKEATLLLAADISLPANTKGDVQLASSVTNNDGQEVASIKSAVKPGTGAAQKVQQELTVSNPVFWDVDHPYLYQITCTLTQNGQILDKYTTSYGIRTVDFSRQKGLMLNGRHLKIQGVCMHHDMGPLGTAINYRAIERQLQIMKSMGVNAIRTSHNPTSPELVDICDHLGLMVMEEAFDEWTIGKVKNGYHLYFDEWHERDLRDMIRRDANHPSIIMWSIGNEILEQGREDGWKVAKMLADICRDEDPTRPTTAGFNYYPAPFDHHLVDYVDLVGMNYKPLKYKEVMDKYPDMIIYGSETSSQTSSRGAYDLSLAAHEQHETGQVSSFDVIVGPKWAYAPDVEFEQQDKHPNVLGEFIWTGFDYLGEPTPYGGRDNSTNGYWNADWPSRSSYFAPVDLSGFPKDRFYLYQSQWTQKPMVHLLPHWNWQGHDGQNIPVFVYTNGTSAELFLNGKSLGKKVKGIDTTPINAELKGFELGIYHSKYRLSWQVPYEPGELKVVAYRDGKPCAEEVVKTAGKPHHLVLQPDRMTIRADGKDLSFIKVSVVDKDGNLCPDADQEVSFKVSGTGILKAVGNGDATSLTSFQDSKRKAFHGLCLLIVQSDKAVGEINIEASARELEGANTMVKTK